MKSTHHTDDTHLRWDSADACEREVWNYFDQVVAPQIVRESMASPHVTLASLYQALSIARFKCEWVKHKKPENRTEIENYANSAMDLTGIQYLNFLKFGYTYLGVAYEPRIFTGTGDEVKTLATMRIQSRNHKLKGTKVGLSDFKEKHQNNSHLANTLVHPLVNPRSSLVRLEQDFQKLRSTNNLFEFLKLASRIMYELANFPPLERGNAAINTWVIDNIFREKFKMTGSIRPHLYDWSAFFDSPEQYTNFFIMSAVVAIIKKIPGLYEQDKRFYDSLRQLMMADPNDIANLKKQKDYWENLKIRVKAAAADGAIDARNKELLQQIYAGDLTFTEPSNAIANMVNEINASKDKDISGIIKRSQIPEEYLVNLLWFHGHTVHEHVTTLGNTPLEQKNASYWADLGQLRKLDYNRLQELKKYLKQPLDEPINPDEECTDARKNAFDRCSFLAKISHANEAEIATVPQRFQNLLNAEVVMNDKLDDLSSRVMRAIMAGGLSLQDLPQLTDEQLSQLTCSAAMSLYNANLFISYRDLLGNNPDDTDKNILRLIAKHYCHEDYTDLQDADIRKLCVSNFELFKIGAIKISELKDLTLADVQHRMVLAYIKDYFKEDLIEIDNGQIEKYYLRIFFLKGLLDNEQNRSGMPGRDMLKVCGIKASVLLHMEMADIAELCNEMRRVTNKSALSSLVSLFASPHKRLDNSMMRKYHEQEQRLGYKSGIR